MAASDTERGLIANYAHRVLSRGDLPIRTLRHVLFWLSDRSELLSLPVPERLSKSVGTIYTPGFSVAELELSYAETRGQLLKDLKRIASEASRPEPVTRNIKTLVGALGLPAAAAEIVALTAYVTRFDQVQYFCESVAEAAGAVPRVLTLLSGEPVRVIEDLIAPSGDLVGSGLLQIAEASDLVGPSGRISIPFRINNALDRNFQGFAEMREALLGEVLSSNIEAADYDHVAADRELIAGVLKGAIDGAERGVNILLYGPPGTGKTELTKVVAAAAGVSLYGAGEDLARGTESDRSTRLADLVFSQRLLAGSKRTALLFDEMEDVAWQLIKRGGSKVYLNRLLETNPVPVFWTSNNILEIDAALLRRMTLAVELRLPPATQRRRILSRVSDRIGLKLDADEVDHLARKLPATPAVLENALRAAKLSGLGAEAAERAGLGIIRAVSGVPPKKPMAFPEFIPELICASLDLVELADQLVKGGNPAFSLCLSGPPGTGKSAFARHLARRLGLEVLQKRASDLLGAFVGESEKRIADAFEEAREAGAFLIFDEADSLLYDRREAVRSWEITQVNEMLTWMEEHALPVCFTTNLMDRLDTASLRRFTFHVTFDCLDRKALARAFAVFFRMSPPPPEGLAFTNLTPGDFAQAAKQADVLGIAGDQRRIVALLADLSRAKPGASGAIGFKV
jgi:SpoVK/Ycf46/Vps4 family AAA+-type ATPase